MARLDPHSYCDSHQPRTTHLSWKARVDFTERRLIAEATLTLDTARGGPLDLDTRELEIREVIDASGASVPFTLATADVFLGTKLTLNLKEGTKSVTLRYRTAPNASALQWLTPAQTLGGKHPFLFSQCQAIHARSVIPVQDTPAVRITYSAELSVPGELTAVMAAAPKGHEGDVWRFEMPQAIPPYLFAFAVGDLKSKDLSPRSRVWSEPGALEAAAWEFAGVEEMVVQAEKLFGPYPWERFDILVMPPSFPYGGMENPRLTFLTPAVVTGDRSLVNVLAHELAHSWTGNLVTNANAEHFWLNEGMTVFAERRILEAIEGSEMAALHAALGWRALEDAIERFADHPEMTKLRTHLEGVDPDEVYSSVPYEKGCLFLTAVENAVGREAFDAYLKKYLARFAFKAITTEEFVAFTREHLPGALEKVNAPEWLDGMGIPKSAPRPSSKRLDAVTALGKTVPTVEQTKNWGATEWNVYLEMLPRDLTAEWCKSIDDAFGLTAKNNFDLLTSWLMAALPTGYAPAMQRTQDVLSKFGRMKYLRPLYRLLASNDKTKPIARQTFEKLKDGYHPIARQTIETLLLTQLGT